MILAHNSWCTIMQMLLIISECMLHLKIIKASYSFSESVALRYCGRSVAQGSLSNRSPAVSHLQVHTRALEHVDLHFIGISREAHRTHRATHTLSSGFIQVLSFRKDFIILHKCYFQITTYGATVYVSKFGYGHTTRKDSYCNLQSCRSQREKTWR